MIDGLKFELSGSEIIGQCAARSKFFRERADHLRGELVRVAPVKGYTSSNGRAYESEAETCTWRAAHFEFLGAHIVPAETYLLTLEQLTELEFCRDETF